MKANDLVGQVFTRLTVTGIAGKNKKQNILWRCSCVCGGEAIATAYDLRAGKVKSCKCLTREGLRTTHGMGKSGSKRSKEYSIWASMLQRCYNRNAKAYKNYGGRGITVCHEWHEFERFYNDMGDKPDKKSLDRIDNDKCYCKTNCEWRTVEEQASNKRNNVLVVINGERIILAGALALFGKSTGHLHYYMKSRNLTHQEVINLWLEQRKV